MAEQHARKDLDVELMDNDQDLGLQDLVGGSHPTRKDTLNRTAARKAEAHSCVSDLADFLNQSRISPAEMKAASRNHPTTRTDGPRFKSVMDGAAEARGEMQRANGENGAIGKSVVLQVPTDGKEIACGPLLNYRRMEKKAWHGSVLVVTKGGGREQPFVPILKLQIAAGKDSRRAVQGSADGHHPSANGDVEGEARTFHGTCLYSDPRNTFWRFDLSVPLESVETEWEYTLPELRFASTTKPKRNSFFVPAATESMRIMFHSCNGFSVGTDEEDWSGPALWNDVIRRHQHVPFHVMIGGGDQIYNDGIRVSGPLKEWTDIGNPKKRRDYAFPESLRRECDDYYLKNYIRWYGTDPFAAVNGQIPQLNIWDDHDIIDGFGSYVDEFMRCDVFRGLGGSAHKYYMLFQHHLPPPPSTFTSTSSKTSKKVEGQGIDPTQLQDTCVHPAIAEKNYIIGSKPGPYVAEHSHNMFARLGARIAFLGIDARTERTRHQVNYPETYDQIFRRLKEELTAAQQSGQPFKHMVLLLGIPIAYPRLTWLENVFTSPIIGPIKFLNRRFGIGGSIFNRFDGSVDLLDDLDDHYTARTHKKERNWLIERLQSICAEFSVRITILGGDVHLAAMGRFYSKPRLNVPVESDYRYMLNVVSSAIVNKPPPQGIANLLSRRNKIHHLNRDTDETLLKFFDKDPGDTNKTANHNLVTMPSRNFAMITENSPNNAPKTGDAGFPGSQAGPLAPPPAHSGHAAASLNGSQPPGSTASQSNYSKGSMTSRARKDGHFAIHAGEEGAGTKHKAADKQAHGTGSDGGLDVCICVEIDRHDREGRTESYGLTVPALDYHGPVPEYMGRSHATFDRLHRAA